MSSYGYIIQCEIFFHFIVIGKTNFIIKSKNKKTDYTLVISSYVLHMQKEELIL